jgi:zinc-finger of transposase IS204/IS1001/IS1096/IS1165
MPENPQKRGIDTSETTITAVVTTTSQEAACPLCHGRPARIHSRYTRVVADHPWMGCAVRLLIVDLHAELPTMSWREIAGICYIR